MEKLGPDTPDEIAASVAPSSSLRVGRFASAALISQAEWESGERPIHVPSLSGQHFDRIEIRMTKADYLDERTHTWIRRVVMPRVTYIGRVPMVITVEL